MEFDKWTTTTYLFWAALLVIVFITNEFAVTMVALIAFSLTLIWQLVQWLIIRRQRKAQLLEAYDRKV